MNRLKPINLITPYYQCQQGPNGEKMKYFKSTSNNLLGIKCEQRFCKNNFEDKTIKVFVT